ncbi:hypothetical protein IGI37_003822 [Enterococcus sp. AZ194]|uniref:LPXTG cell wall anchor domain-containing protein n=1 Tax=Enterococcus sp. AZ194 TaxID=2774629 RepID=UPI003F20E785
MKKLLCSFAMLFFIASVPSTVNAEDVGEYDSNGVTSFYGTYEYPTEESSDERPPEPDKPTPVTPIDKPGAGQINSNGAKILPATGDDHFNKFQLLGVAILGVSTLFILRREKHEKNNNLDSRNHLI